MAELKLTGDEARAIVRAAHPGGSDHPQGIDYVRATIEYLNRREMEPSASPAAQCPNYPCCPCESKENCQNA